jgi:hypothetical protein
MRLERILSRDHRFDLRSPSATSTMYLLSEPLGNWQEIFTRFRAKKVLNR